MRMRSTQFNGIIAYDASFQRHGIVREFVKNLDRKLIILGKHNKHEHRNIVVVLTLFARISGAGNTPLARAALQIVKNAFKATIKINSRSVIPIWRNKIVRDMKLAHGTKHSDICWSGR